MDLAYPTVTYTVAIVIKTVYTAEGSAQIAPNKHKNFDVIFLCFGLICTQYTCNV